MSRASDLPNGCLRTDVRERANPAPHEAGRGSTISRDQESSSWPVRSLANDTAMSEISAHTAMKTPTGT